jgi:hypothetical protein
MKTIRFAWLASLALCAGFFSCEEKALPDDNIPQTFPDMGSTAFVKFIHAYAGKAPALTSGAGPNVFMYLGTQKITGAAMGWSISAGQYPAPTTAANNARSWYTAVPGGNYAALGVLARVAAGVPAPNAGDTIFRGNVALTAGKSYTLFLSDTVQNPSLTLVEDNVNPTPQNKYRIRLANFIAWPGDVVELYSRREGRIIQTGIGYKGVGNFVELDILNRTDTFEVRKLSGSSPGTYTFLSPGVFPAGKRDYTIVARGKQISGTSSVFQNAGVVVSTNY